MGLLRLGEEVAVDEVAERQGEEVHRGGDHVDLWETRGRARSCAGLDERRVGFGAA